MLSLSVLADLSAAVQKFSQSLQEFQFECIGDAETDDEVNIGKFSLARSRRTHLPLFGDLPFSLLIPISQIVTSVQNLPDISVRILSGDTRTQLAAALTQIRRANVLWLRTKYSKYDIIIFERFYTSKKLLKENGKSVFRLN